MCWVNRSTAIITNINHTGNNRDVNLYAAIGKNTGGRSCQTLAAADAVSVLV